VVRHYPKANTTWLTAAILKIDIAVAAAILRNEYDVIFPQWVLLYGGRLYFETESSHISAAN